MLRLQLGIGLQSTLNRLFAFCQWWHLHKVNKSSGAHFQTLFSKIFLFFDVPQYSNRFHSIKDRRRAISYFNNQNSLHITFKPYHVMSSAPQNPWNRCVWRAIPLSDPDQDSQWISVQIQLANRMTLDVSNVSRIHFGFGFIVNPDPDPIIEYALKLQYCLDSQSHRSKFKVTGRKVPVWTQPIVNWNESEWSWGLGKTKPVTATWMKSRYELEAVNK